MAASIGWMTPVGGERMAIRPRERTLDEKADIYDVGAVAVCPICEGILGTGFPLWGVHLYVAVTLHAAHRAAEELRSVPALTDTDRLFGRRIEVVS